MDSKKVYLSIIVSLIFLLSSCNGAKNLVVPHAVNSADAIPLTALNLQKGDYDILGSITENAAITAKYSGNSLKITSGDGEFAYDFGFDKKTGWSLKTFKGTATFGYISSDVNGKIELPEAEEFARRVAIARLIEIVKDYGADGIIDPIVTTRATNSGRNTVEYQATVTAKIIKIHTSSK